MPDDTNQTPAPETFERRAKAWWRSLTVWFSAALISAPTWIPQVQAYAPGLPPKYAQIFGAVLSGIGVVSVLLRVKTTQPVGLRDK